MKTTSRFILPVILLSLHGSLVCGQGADNAGHALSFNGVNNAMLIGGNPVSPPWTAEFWVKRQDASGFSAALLADTNSALKIEQFNYTRKVGFTQFGVADYMFNYSAPTGIWVHLAFVADTQTRLYVNGVLQDTVSATIKLPLDRLGSDALYGDYSKGILDEVRVWDVARSQSDIQSNMYRSVGIGDPCGLCLVAYWRFDEGEGSYAFDNSGHGLTGTLVNSPLWVASTIPFIPGVATLAASQIKTNSATLNGWVNLNGFPTTTWFQWGTTTNYGNSVLIPDNCTCNFVRVTSSITNLTPHQLYNYRVAASNSFGVAFGENVGFSADFPFAPGGATLPASQVTTNSATLNGQFNPNGFSTRAWFEWGITTNYGNIAIDGPDTDMVASATSSITNLTPHQLYNYRVVASNSFGVAFGDNVSFSADVSFAPGAATLAASQVTTNSATLNGWVNPNGSTTTTWFQWGTTTNYGNIAIPPHDNTGTVARVTSSLTDLTPYQLYNYRLVASNSFGIAFGGNFNFFAIPSDWPEVVTLPAGQATTNSATLNGWVNPNGFPTTAWFEWGGTTNYGNIAIPPNPNTGMVASVAYSVTNLTPYQLYNFRLVASNSYGIAFGDNLSFPAGIPQLEIFRGITPGTNVVLRWPAAATNYFLESTTNLTGSAVWSPWPDPPNIVSNQNTVAWPGNPPSDRGFFRLHQQ